MPYDNTGGFAIHEVKCPSCNGSLDLRDNEETLTCPYCGSTVHVSYGQSDGQGSIEPDGTIRDRGTGYGLFRANISNGWRVVSTQMQPTGCSSRPHYPRAELRDRAGGTIVLALGEAGARRSAGLNAMMGMYGGHLSGIDTANYADVPDPIRLADEAASSIAANMGASGIRFERQLACPDLESKKQACFARFQRYAQAQGASVANPFMAVVMRTYELAKDGQPWKAAVYVTLSACKDGMGVGEGFGNGIGNMMGGLGGIASGIGNLFGGQGQAPSGGGGRSSGAMDFFLGGGLIGKMRQDAQQAPMQQGMQNPMQSNQAPFSQGQQQAYAPQAATQCSSWCSPDFAQYTSGGTIFWDVGALVTFFAPANDFDNQFQSAFIPLVNSLETHPDVENLAMQAVVQEAAQINQSTQTQLSQNQAAFQAQQAAHRQQQAAFDSYNQSISDARDSRHRQFMSSSNAQFQRSAPDFSEAIRGVNTYTTSDGREVELSVHADHAWENQAGDVIGTSGSADPGASWTEIPRT